MKITEITVHAGRVIPHPFISYSNLKPGLSFKAALEEGEDPVEATKKLQAQAEGMLEEHCRHMVQSLEELNDLTEKQAKVASLERSIRSAQMDLDRIRAGIPALEVTRAPKVHVETWPGMSSDDGEEKDDLMPF